MTPVTPIHTLAVLVAGTGNVGFAIIGILRSAEVFNLTLR